MKNDWRALVQARGRLFRGGKRWQGGRLSHAWLGGMTKCTSCTRPVPLVSGGLLCPLVAPDADGHEELLLLLLATLGLG
eukprot:10370158-Alexandrium_andersonii.AAC.1